MVKRRKKDLASTDYVISNFAGPYVKWILVVFSLVSVIFPLYWLTIVPLSWSRITGHIRRCSSPAS